VASDGRLYVGAQDAADNLVACRAAGITHIVSILENFYEPPWSTFLHVIPKWCLVPHIWWIVYSFAKERSFDLTAHAGISYYRITEEDEPNTDLSKYFESTSLHIQKTLSSSPLSKVLVHCASGISRSATIAIAYELWQRKHRGDPIPSVDHIIEEFLGKRDVICPNPGFLSQLARWQQHLCLNEPLALLSHSLKKHASNTPPPDQKGSGPLPIPTLVHTRRSYPNQSTVGGLSGYLEVLEVDHGVVDVEWIGEEMCPTHASCTIDAHGQSTDSQ